MKNAPIKAISYFNGLVYANSNILYYNDDQVEFENVIVDIKVFENIILIIFKRQVVILNSNFTIAKISDLFDTNIATVHLSNYLYILLYNGILIRYNATETTFDLIDKKKIFDKTIISAKIFDNRVIIGSFDSIYQIDLSNESLEQFCIFKNIHSGRIFDIFVFKEGIISCADDRAIVFNGKKIVQEFRDYFYHIQDFKRCIYTFNRDGFLRIYQENQDSFEYQLLYSKFFGKESLESLFLYDNIIYIGTKGGCIFKLENNRVDLIFGPKIEEYGIQKIFEISGNTHLYRPNLIFQNGFLENEDFRMSIHRRPLDCTFHLDTLYLLYSGFILVIKDGYVQKEITYQINHGLPKNEIFSRLAIHDSLVYIYHNTYAHILCKNCFNILKVIEFNCINLIKDGIIGTKFGCIILDDKLMKMSEFSICDIQVTGDKIYILDSEGYLYKSELSCLINEDTSSYSIKCLDCDKSNYLSEVSDIHFNEWLNLRKELLVNLSCENEKLKSLSFTKFPQMINLTAHISFDSQSIGLYSKYNLLSNNIYNYSNSIVKECEKYKYLKKETIDCRSKFSYRKYDKVGNIMAIGLLESSYNFYRSENNNIEKCQITKVINTTVSFSNFTAIGFYSGLKILGTEQGIIFILKDNKIVDHLSLIGSIIGICTLNNLLIFTRPGYIYSLEMFDDKIFIRNKVDFGVKITCCYLNIVCFSNGEVFKICEDLKLDLIAKTDCYISSIYQSLVSFSGKLCHLNDLKDNKIQISKNVVNKNINKICQFKDYFVAVGDDQSIGKFDRNLNELYRMAIHSAQIFDVLISEKFIYTLSSDMRICVLDHNFNISRYLNHSVRNPKFLELENLNRLLVYGESLEYISI